MAQGEQSYATLQRSRSLYRKAQLTLMNGILLSASVQSSPEEYAHYFLHVYYLAETLFSEMLIFQIPIAKTNRSAERHFHQD